jgi:hypothetical protein
MAEWQCKVTPHCSLSDTDHLSGVINDLTKCIFSSTLEKQSLPGSEKKVHKNKKKN